MEDPIDRCLSALRMYLSGRTFSEVGRLNGGIREHQVTRERARQMCLRAALWIHLHPDEQRSVDIAGAVLSVARRRFGDYTTKDWEQMRLALWRSQDEAQ